jgi:hypothetical protein
MYISRCGRTHIKQNAAGADRPAGKELLYQIHTQTTGNINKPGKVYSIPEYTEFPRAFFATRILKYQIRLAPRNRFVKNINCFD